MNSFVEIMLVSKIQLSLLKKLKCLRKKGLLLKKLVDGIQINDLNLNEKKKKRNKKMKKILIIQLKLLISII